ncbi:MAG: nitronate monooxygenase [Alphaproteobacteria bacterium]|nr:nitronate monooxygenase [Alphaproteobacteria bacterium]
MDISRFWSRGTEFLGTKYAIMAGAMSWVSEHNLVSAISNAGGFGVLACGSMDTTLLRKEIKLTKQKTNKPFGVNLITMHPEIQGLAKVCVEEKVSHVVLAGGLPKASYMEFLKSSGIKILCFAPALSLAKRLIKLGADALIIEGMEAGGHIGPVSTAVLAQEILPHIKEVPVFVAGGIGRGEMIANYLRMGASGCQLGTKFVCANESIAHQNFKNMFIKASARDAMVSTQVDPDFSVIPVRALSNKATAEFSKAQVEAISKFKSGDMSKGEAQLEIEKFWAGALRRAVIDGDIETGSVMAGQSVGMVECEQSAEEIIEDLVEYAQKSFDNENLELESAV